MNKLPLLLLYCLTSAVHEAPESSSNECTMWTTVYGDRLAKDVLVGELSLRAKSQGPDRKSVHLLLRAVDGSNYGELKRILAGVHGKDRDTLVAVGMGEAIDQDLSKVVKFLFEMSKEAPKQIHGFPVLAYAAFKGAKRSVCYLAPLVDNYEKDGFGMLAIHFAVISGPSIIGKLAKDQSLVNAKDRSGRTPLHYAARSRFDSMVKLLNCGARSDIRDSNGKTAYEYLKESSMRIGFWMGDGTRT